MDEFSQFYAAYPRKTAKGAARKAWERMARIEPDLLTKCLTALAWQTTSAQWTKDGGEFVPYPATYLNQERYDDERPMTADERAARANYEAWLAQNAHDPAARTISFEAFQHYQRERRRA
jgi:hypothetical protein